MNVNTITDDTENEAEIANNNNNTLKKSNLVKTIDINLSIYYQQNGRNDYYEEINENGTNRKIGKFAKYCMDKAYDSDAIEGEVGDDADAENCEIIEFDPSLPIHPNTPKEQIDREKFSVLRSMYSKSFPSKSFPSPSISNSKSLNSTYSTQSTPQFTPHQLYNINTPKQLSFESCYDQQSIGTYHHSIIHEIEHDDIKQNEINDLQPTCRAIGEWYKIMNKYHIYYDENGNGLFSKWFDGEGMEINEMNDEFEEEENCGYISFHIDKETQINYFPLPPDIKHNDKEHIQFEIMSYCFNYGKAPNIENIMLSNNKIFPFHPFDSLDYVIDTEWKQKTAKIYNELCPNLYAAITNQEENLMNLFAVGYKHKIPLVQLLTDTFMRDRIKYYIKDRESPITKMLEVYEWAINNIYITYLVKKYSVSIRNIISSAIQSYIKRIVPVFRMDSVTKIMDNVREIALHFKAASEFIHNLLDNTLISNAPYQWDFCIAVRECSMLESEIMMKPEFSDPDLTIAIAEDFKNDQEQNTYYDVLGDIQDKLKQNECKFIEEEFDPNKYNDIKAMSYLRCYVDAYNKFIGKYKIKKDKFPRNSRFCTLIDRRKMVTKYENDKYIEVNRNGDGNKKDDMLFWIPPNDCNKIRNTDGIKEVYFDYIAQCLIPNIDYNETDKSNKYSDTEQIPKYKELRETITSSSKCNGGLLIFSFQIEADDEIACYLWWQHQCIRFLPQDIVQILPEIFISSEENRRFVEESKVKDMKAKPVNNIVNEIKYYDRKFDDWYKRMNRNE